MPEGHMAKIETFENTYPERDYIISISNPEYTSKCPMTGLPDFGTINIRYNPDKLVLELKSLKMYFLEYRDKGIFYEEAVNRILDDLVMACKPRWMEITGEFSTRGGMASEVQASFGTRTGIK
jgi:7-cyano-7-deazaguanine reductase